MLRRLPPILLLAVALNQFALAFRAQLTPWNGGAFGMFSTTDRASARHLHVYALDPSLRIELEIPHALAERAHAVAALPSDAALRAFAREISAHAESEFEPPDAIRVEVFATRYDELTLAPSGVLLRALEVPLERP